MYVRSRFCEIILWIEFFGQIKSRPHHENLLCLFFSLCRMYFVSKKTNVTETINWKKGGWAWPELLRAMSSSIWTWFTFVWFSILYRHVSTLIGPQIGEKYFLARMMKMTLRESECQLSSIFQNMNIKRVPNPQSRITAWMFLPPCVCWDKDFRTLSRKIIPVPGLSILVILTGIWCFDSKVLMLVIQSSDKVNIMQLCVKRVETVGGFFLFLTLEIWTNSFLHN